MGELEIMGTQYGRITFPTEKFNDYDRRIRMVFDCGITVGADDYIEIDAADDWNLRMAKIGTLQWDTSESVISPGVYEVDLIDGDLELRDRLFKSYGSSPFPRDKRARVTIERYVTDTWVEEYAGNIYIKNIRYVRNEKKLKLYVAPKTDAMKNAKALDGHEKSSLYSIRQILHEIFKTVNPALGVNDVIIEHDWEFRGQKYGSGTLLTGLTIEDIGVTVSWYIQYKSCTSKSDLLKALCEDFFATAGFLADGTPFFRNIGNAEGTLQVISDNQIVESEEFYNENLIDYVKVQHCSRDSREAVILAGGTRPNPMEVPSPMPVLTQEKREIILGFWQEVKVTTNPPSPYTGAWYQTNLVHVKTDPVEVYWIMGIKSPAIGIFLGVTEAIAKLYYDRYNSLVKGRCLEVTLNGIDYSIFDVIEIDGDAYTIETMTRDYDQVTTQMQLVPVEYEDEYSPEEPAESDAPLTENETPEDVFTGDGSEVVFTLAEAYEAGSTKVYVNGLRQLRGVDYNEENETDIRFVEAPETDDVIIVDYTAIGG